MAGWGDLTLQGGGCPNAPTENRTSGWGLQAVRARVPWLRRAPFARRAAVVPAGSGAAVRTSSSRSGKHYFLRHFSGASGARRKSWKIASCGLMLPVDGGAAAAVDGVSGMDAPGSGGSVTSTAQAPLERPGSQVTYMYTYILAPLGASEAKFQILEVCRQQGPDFRPLPKCPHQDFRACRRRRHRS